MSAMSIAMSGMLAATARLEASAQNTANAETRGPPPTAAPYVPANPMATPIPKVYRPIRANLYSMATGGGVGVVYQQIAPGYFSIYDPMAPEADDKGAVAMPAVYPDSERLEQIQAAVHYRVSAQTLKTAVDMQDAAIDILS